jgi:hypothetical protein
VFAEDHKFIAKYEQIVRAVRDKPNKLASQKKEYLTKFLLVNKPTREKLQAYQNGLITNLVEKTIKQLDKDIENESEQ